MCRTVPSSYLPKVTVEPAHARMRYSTLGVKRAILETRTLRDEFTCDLRFDDSRSPKVKINRCLFRFFFRSYTRITYCRIPRLPVYPTAPA